MGFVRTGNSAIRSAVPDNPTMEQTRHVGVAKSEHPRARLTNGEIFFEEFQPM